MSTHQPATDHAEALAAALEGVSPLPVETVPLAEALGRVLRSEIVADRDLPPRDRARMDGYALRAEDLAPGRALPVAGEVRAGEDGALEVPPGACVRIATGAPLPEGLDAVIEHERSDREDPVRFELESIEPGRSVHRRGADARAGDVLRAAGVRLGPTQIGLLATVGRDHVEVSRRPSVAILASGDELVPVAERPAPHQMRESNAPMIEAVLRSFGADVAARVHVLDDPTSTRTALADVLGRVDLLVTIGGISAGEHDHVRPALESLGVRWRVAGARIKPGRPIHVGGSSEGTTVCCLPGNPVSALVCAHLFCRPLVAALTARTDDPTWERRPLASPVAGDPARRTFRPARLDADGRLVIPRWQGSGDLAHLADCTGLVELVPGDAERGLPYLDWRTA